MPLSFYEQAGKATFNSLAMIDADGAVLGVYRKSHIPDGAGYQEKYYFNPGDTGFRVWPTRYGAIGVAICFGADGSRRRRVQWPCWVRSFSSIPQPSAANRSTPTTTPAATGSA